MSIKLNIRGAVCCASTLLLAACGLVDVDEGVPGGQAGSAGGISSGSGGREGSAAGSSGDSGQSQAGVPSTAGQGEGAGQAGALSIPQSGGGNGGGEPAVGGAAGSSGGGQGGDASPPWPSSTECPPGEYVTAAATQTNDAECSTCPLGTYSSQVNAPSCSEWRRCHWKEVEQASGTPSSDRDCTPGSVFRQFGTSERDVASSVTVDSAGNVLVAGYTSGSLQGTSAGGEDAFVRKFDVSGNVLWTQQFGSDAGDAANAIAADLAGNIYVAGSSFGSMAGTIAGEGPNVGGRNCFIRKLDAKGNLLWARQFGSSGEDVVYAVAVEPAGSLYVAGYTLTTPGSSGGSVDAFVRKFDGAGNVLWDFPFGTGADDLAHSVAVDAAGDVYVAGRTSGSLRGENAGAYDAFVRKLDSTGNVLWTNQFGTGRDDDAYSLALAPDGQVYLAGSTLGSLQAIVRGEGDAFVSKLNAAGNILWTRQMGTSNVDIGMAVVVGSTGNVFVGGYTSGSFAGKNNAGAVDGFVQEFDPTGAVRQTFQFGTLENEFPFGLAVDGAGHVYAAGFTSGSLQGPNAGLVDALVLQLEP
ncbi:MAG TPA: SBBP repeat-containing protein [Polyangiaceae bacterium]|nr:SBBP repeat-containing protein [Polyangiaceae bacterium]